VGLTEGQYPPTFSRGGRLANASRGAPTLAVEGRLGDECSLKFRFKSFFVDRQISPTHSQGTEEERTTCSGGPVSSGYDASAKREQV
jgi:hypothetical protein